MTTVAMIVIGIVVGLLVSITLVAYFAIATWRDEKSPAVAVLLSLILGPFVGFAYARPNAWVSGLVAELCFVAPIAGWVAVLATSGQTPLAAVVGAYLVAAVGTTSVLMAQDQNEAVGATAGV